MIKYIKIGDYKKAFNILLDDECIEARICKELLLKYITYSLKISSEVSTDISSCDDAMATGFSWIPPIALIEVLGGKEIVKEKVKQYLSKDYFDILNNDEIYNNIPVKSKYDYRSFLKGKY